jgi:hypothetical protein
MFREKKIFFASKFCVMIVGLLLLALCVLSVVEG